VGEEFTRLPNDGKIETVTSSAMSRLGNPIIFALQDETGSSTRLEQAAEGRRDPASRRGGMGGRSIETTNPWDPSEDSVAQRTWESKRPDVFKFWRNPELEPSAASRGRHAVQVHGRSRAPQDPAVRLPGITHVDLDGIEAEALELMEKDPGQAERFYGNRIVAGLGHWWLPRERGTARRSAVEVPAGTQIVVGFDGSDVDDWTGFRCETRDGYQFTPKFPTARR
jgi:hypothetical protein